MILPFGPYEPDKSDYRSALMYSGANVYPRADGWGPVSALAAASQALASACRGAFVTRKTDGSIVVFAGTSTRLQQMSNSDFSWVPVSKVTALTSISNASPAVFTLAGHGLAAGDSLRLTTSGALPAGLGTGITYYVLAAGLTADEFRVSLTSGGTAINTSSAGSGTHSMTYKYTAAPTSHHWKFAQFGNFVIAVQHNAAPQVFDLSSSSAFADLGGSPPAAGAIAVVGRFLVLSDLLGNPFRVHWSGLNATTTWTSGTNQSDYQDLPDGGIVLGVAGDEQGAVILQDATTRRMTYAPGSPAVFQIDRIAKDAGLFARHSVVQADDRVFWWGNDGFKMLAPGGYPEPIGREVVDRTMLAAVDQAGLQYVIAAADPRFDRVYFSWRSAGSSQSLFDRIVAYDYVLKRWSPPIVVSGEYLASMASPGLTLENLDTISSSIDAMTVSLDDFATQALSKLAAFDSAHKLGFFSGANLEATLYTAEQALEDRVVRVQGFRPITDAATAYGSLETRMQLSDAVVATAETAKNAKGVCPQNRTTRLARGKLRIPAATTWTYASGAEPQMQGGGRQ